MSPKKFLLPFWQLLASAGLAAQPAPSVSLASLAARYGFPPPAPGRQSVTLAGRHTVLTFTAGSRQLVANGVQIWMNAAVIQQGSLLVLSEADATKVIDPLVRPDSALARRSCRLVVLDPGHGGTDSGAMGAHGLDEKKIVLEIARRVAIKLQASQVPVRLTRTKDQEISLGARTALARKWGADIYVSIHLNASRNPEACGIETYVAPAAGFPSTSGANTTSACINNAFDECNTILAFYVHKGMVVRSRAMDRGIRRARFSVIKEAPCPAVLLECGFLSNRGEATRLGRRDYLDTIAEGIAQGLLTYVSKTNSR